MTSGGHFFFVKKETPKTARPSRNRQAGHCFMPWTAKNTYRHSRYPAHSTQREARCRAAFFLAILTVLLNKRRILLKLYYICIDLSKTCGKTVLQNCKQAVTASRMKVVKNFRWYLYKPYIGCYTITPRIAAFREGAQEDERTEEKEERHEC